jgi:hypothetical protein
MFKLFIADRRRAPHRSSTSVLISTAAHVIVVGVLLTIPTLYVSAETYAFCGQYQCWTKQPSLPSGNGATPRCC